MTDIRDIAGLWCDDITFCQEECGWRDCPRNKENIRDRTVPHSFSVEIPQDCPKKGKKVNRMPDREKVLTGLECLIADEVLCKECPYDRKHPYCIKSIVIDAKRLIEEKQQLIDEITQRRANNGAFD